MSRNTGCKYVLHINKKEVKIYNILRYILKQKQIKGVETVAETK